ncbi:MAG: hypothetical protein R3E58_17920 [Phycisphaerae bacterium]|nr:hypothetical protein [Phycisphaerales bacterium]
MMVRATKKTTARKAPKKSAVARKKTPTKKTSRRKSAGTPSAASVAPGELAKTPLPIEEYRQRLGAVGRLMRAALADLEAGAPGGDRVGQGAYLQVMGRAFEVLDGLSQSVDVDDLVKISKVVAEQRRAELNHRKLQMAVDAADAGAHSNGDVGPRDVELPDSFGEIVRQIYGATLASDLNGAVGGG